MPTKPPQPQRLGGSASAPSLSGQPVDPRHESAEAPPPGYAPVGVATRPGRQQLPVTGNSASLGASASNALYGQPSFSSLYVEPEDLEPGPGTYDIPTGLGYQHVSTRQSVPSISLTAKHDKSWAKVMITKAHNDAFKCRGTPGPGTYVPNLPENQARIRFGTGKRKPLADANFRAPGPVYEVRGVPDNPPAQVRFGKADRFSDGASLANQLGSAGPGQYELATVFDGVKHAKSFGASHRAYDHVRFPGSDKEGVGKQSPGPGAMKQFFNDGQHVGFGRAERLPKDNAGKRAPGPGAYEAHNRAYPFSRNQSCYSFGRPHAKGRMDWKKAGKATNTTWGIC